MNFKQRVHRAVRKIPLGRVAIYGQIAKLAGQPRAYRAVGNILHQNPSPEHKHSLRSCIMFFRNPRFLTFSPSAKACFPTRRGILPLRPTPFVSEFQIIEIPIQQDIPCHRVVNSWGRLAKEFAFGGLTGQKKRLEQEGVMVQDHKVDLVKYKVELR